MQIESGITSWWRNRHLLFIGLLVAAAGWFGYDGWIKYPATNRAWASQAIGIPADSIQTNPQVIFATVNEINQELSGRPASFDEVLAVHEKHLGKPSYQKGQQYWWVGPAMYIKLDPSYVSPTDPTTGKTSHWREISEPPSGSREGQIRGQKWFAAGTLILAALVGLKLILVMRTRVVLDDAGLRYNRQSISWEAMTGLRGQDYERKLWVYLEYSAADVTRSLRLDSLHIDKFKEILTAICERKGFTNPLAPKGPKPEAEQGGTAQG